MSVTEEDLELELESLTEKRDAIYEKLEKMKSDRLKAEFSHLPDHYKEFLVGRLTRLKAYFDGLHRTDVGYKIEKIEQPINDFHEPTRDYLNWTIEDGCLLDMMFYVQVTIKIHSELVKKFVEDWIKENIKGMSEFHTWIDCH